MILMEEMFICLGEEVIIKRELENKESIYNREWGFWGIKRGWDLE